MSVLDLDKPEEKLEYCDLLAHKFRFGKRDAFVKTGFVGRMHAIYYPKNWRYQGKKLRRSLFIYWIDGKKKYARDIDKLAFLAIVNTIEQKEKEYLGLNK